VFLNTKHILANYNLNSTQVCVNPVQL